MAGLMPLEVQEIGESGVPERCVGFFAAIALARWRPKSRVDLKRKFN
ncbi:MAG: hypothetical protein PVJ55_04370 [Anaerolineae bacterium]|jgi:hypothetical protein